MRSPTQLLLTAAIVAAGAGCAAPLPPPTPDAQVAASATPEIASASPSAPASTLPPAPSTAPSAAPASPTPTPAANAANPAPFDAANPEAPYQPAFDPETFGGPVDNPFFPLVPGTTWEYRGGGERVVTTVTDRTRDIVGITATVVHDRVFEAGELVEDTFDWYAQDAAGNVWYLGEATRELDHGRVTTTEGSWETGVDGALPGVIMLADPVVGTSYRQEFLPGEAEDLATVTALDEPVDVPAGAYRDTVTTDDFTPLEPDVLERKTYAAGVGVVEERTVRGGHGVVRLLEVRMAAG